MATSLGKLLALPPLGTSSAAASTNQSPCKLATQAEAKAAFGGTVAVGKVAVGKVEKSFQELPPAITASRVPNLARSGEDFVAITPGQTAATFITAKKEVPGVVSVSGVGNRAFCNPNTTAIEFIKETTVANDRASSSILADPR